MEKSVALDEGVKEKLNQGKVVQIAPEGISMLPFVRGGRDKVLVRKEAEVKVGDIVLVPYGDHLILHRVYAVNGPKITLMGDGNLKGTEQVDVSDVWGTVLQIIKTDGRWHKPHRAWLWRHTLCIRKPMLKMRRKWLKLRKQNPE